MERRYKRSTIANPYRFYTFVTMLVMALAFMLIVANAVLLQPNHVNAVSENPTTQEIVVHRGDTVWSIAQTYANGRDKDVREIVAQIIDLNDLTQASIYPGQPLLVPSL